MEQDTSASATGEVRGKIGVVASSMGALREVTCLLSRQGVPAARAVVPGGEQAVPTVAQFLDSLQTLQNDPELEVVVAVVAEPSAADDEVLAQIEASDRPTVLCLLGGDVCRAWQAGAIPARRLDEAAQRAAAWVRGWDQALASSLLAEQDEALTVMAAGLRRLIGEGPRGIVGLYASEALCREAWLMLRDVAGESVYLDCAGLTRQRVSEALADPGAGILILDVAVADPAPEAQVDEVITALERLQGPGPVVIAHLCGTERAAIERAEARLEQAGVTIVGSNAAAARLAGLVVSE